MENNSALCKQYGWLDEYTTSKVTILKKSGFFANFLLSKKHTMF